MNPFLKTFWKAVALILVVWAVVSFVIWTVLAFVGSDYPSSDDSWGNGARHLIEKGWRVTSRLLDWIGSASFAPGFIKDWANGWLAGHPHTPLPEVSSYTLSVWWAWVVVVFWLFVALTAIVLILLLVGVVMGWIGRVGRGGAPSPAGGGGGGTPAARRSFWAIAGLATYAILVIAVVLPLFLKWSAPSILNHSLGLWGSYHSTTTFADQAKGVGCDTSKNMNGVLPLQVYYACADAVLNADANGPQVRDIRNFVAATCSAYWRYQAAPQSAQSEGTPPQSQAANADGSIPPQGAIVMHLLQLVATGGNTPSLTKAEVAAYHTAAQEYVNNGGTGCFGPRKQAQASAPSSSHHQIWVLVLYAVGACLVILAWRVNSAYPPHVGVNAVDWHSWRWWGQLAMITAAALIIWLIIWEMLGRL